MATSTRNKAIELWHNSIPPGDNEKLAKTLFCYENPPGTDFISGSQDSLGIVLPGLNKLDYNNNYWPNKIKTNNNKETLDWIENNMYLLSLNPRIPSFRVLEHTEINEENAKNLALAAEKTWTAILNKDINSFGKNFTLSFEAQVKMFPNMVNKEIFDIIEPYKKTALGWKLSGAGGGGYLILISEKNIENAIRIKIKRD
jgi:galactokinase/mevalonate kinase-like predicted kinase